jgi:hypothetical protein
MATDSPKYTVEKKDGPFEVRKYEAYIVAQVQVDSDFGGSMNAGFDILAGYIFGNNRGRRTVPMTAPVTEERLPMTAPVTTEKLPMTTPVRSEKLTMETPVTEEKDGADRYLISFVMPHDQTLETLPLPVDSRISFHKIEGHRAAVVTFSGWLNDERKAQKKIGELRAWVDGEGLRPISGFVVAQYNSPWIPGPMRRNEIIVAVE